jgi:hypothetical protein
VIYFVDFDVETEIFQVRGNDTTTLLSTREKSVSVMVTLLLLVFPFLIAADKPSQSDYTGSPISLVRPNSPLLEFKSWGSASLWFENRDGRTTQEHYFLPDVYSSGLTIIEDEACAKDTNSSGCIAERGPAFNISNTDGWNAAPSTMAIRSFFAPNSWQNLWWNMSANASTLDNDEERYGSLDTEVTPEASLRIGRQTSRLIHGRDPFIPTIGLAPLSSDSPQGSSQQKSFLWNIKDLAHLPGLSWSYADAQPYARKFEFTCSCHLLRVIKHSDFY